MDGREQKWKFGRSSGIHHKCIDKSTTISVKGQRIPLRRVLWKVVIEWSRIFT
jgi:hypothetical protein